MHVLTLIMDWDCGRRRKKSSKHPPNKQGHRGTPFCYGFIKHRQPDTDAPSLPSESLALQRPSIFMAADINHQQTLTSCCEMVEEPPTVIVPFLLQAKCFTHIQLDNSCSCWLQL